MQRKRVYKKKQRGVEGLRNVSFPSLFPFSVVLGPGVGLSPHSTLYILFCFVLCPDCWYKGKLYLWEWWEWPRISSSTLLDSWGELVYVRPGEVMAVLWFGFLYLYLLFVRTTTSTK